MNSQNSHREASKAIETIVRQGGESLYHRYLEQKIPTHLQQQSQSIIHQTFSPGYQSTPKKATCGTIVNPQSARADYLTPNKLKRGRNYLINSQAQEKKNEGEKNNYNKGKGIQSGKPNICIENPPLQVDQNPEEEVQLRKSKRKSLKKQREKEMENLRNEQKLSARERLLKQKIKDLNNQKVPIFYDEDGSIITPNPREYRINQLKLKNRKQKMINLNYKTIDFNTNQILQPKYKSLTGRRKGISNFKQQKKLKMSNEEYNNNHDRQYSTIPFLNLCNGVKILEKQRNVTASKTRSSDYTRQSYIKDYQNSFFKSFIPDTGDQVSALSMQTVSIDRNRPFTTDQLNRTKRTVETGMNETKRSILWRPSTTARQSRQNKFHINNIQLAKQITIE